MRKIISFIFILINSCSYPEMSRNELIYFNDFEDSNLTNIDGGNISYYNGSNVLGQFNNDGFSINLNEIGNHEYLFVSFDLYIHGSWDGNFNGFQDDKPDLWGIELKPEMDLHQNTDSENFLTTFSNSPCFDNYCLRQSYPETYPYENNPMKGYFTVLEKNICTNSFFGGPTTLYKIEKGFRSSGNAILIRFFDKLYQPNAIDNYGNNVEKCDESWSIDNISIRLVSY